MPKKSAAEVVARARASGESAAADPRGATTALIPSSDGRGSDQHQHQHQHSDPLTEEQCVWLSFRAQVSTDEQATRKVNSFLALEKPLTTADIQHWYRQERFAEMLVAVVGTDPVTSFARLSETLFPFAYRALRSLLVEGNASGKAKGLELLFKLNGMLIDRVKTDAPETIEAMTRALTQLREVGIVEVYRSPQISEPVVDGELINGDDRRGD